MRLSGFTNAIGIMSIGLKRAVTSNFPNGFPIATVTPMRIGRSHTCLCIGSGWMNVAASAKACRLRIPIPRQDMRVGRMSTTPEKVSNRITANATRNGRTLDVTAVRSWVGRLWDFIDFRTAPTSNALVPVIQCELLADIMLHYPTGWLLSTDAWLAHVHYTILTDGRARQSQCILRIRGSRAIWTEYLHTGSGACLPCPSCWTRRHTDTCGAIIAEGSPLACGSGRDHDPLT